MAALLGLFAMHGLAAHGTAHQEHASEPMVMVSSRHSDASMTEEHEAEESPVSSTPGDRTSDSGLLGIAGLCPAVVLAGVVLAVVLGRGIALKGDRGSRLRAGERPTSWRYRDAASPGDLAAQKWMAPAGHAACRLACRRTDTAAGRPVMTPWTRG